MLVPLWGVWKVKSSLRCNKSGEKRGHLLVGGCPVAGSGFGMPREPVVIGSDPEHDRLSRLLFHRSGMPPMRGIGGGADGLIIGITCQP